MANYFDRYDSSPEETPEPSGNSPLPPGTRFDIAGVKSPAILSDQNDVPNTILRGAVEQGLLAPAEGVVRGGAQLGSKIGAGIVERNILGDEHAKLNATLGELQRAQMMGESPERARQIEQVRSRIGEIEAKAAPALAGARSVEFEGTKPLAEGIKTAREAVIERFPVTPDFQQSFGGLFLTGLAQAAGQLPSYMIPGLGPAMSLGQLYQEGYDDAKSEGASDEVAKQAGAANVPAAALDYVADKTVLGRFLKSIKGKMTVGDLLKSVAVSAGSEGLTEGAQQAWQNLVANSLVGYDKERDIDDDVIQSAILGALVGGTVNVAGTTVGAAREKQLPATTPQPVSETQATAGIPGEQPTPAATKVQEFANTWQSDTEGAPEKVTVVEDPGMTYNGFGVRGEFKPNGEIILNAHYIKDPDTGEVDPKRVQEVLNHEWAHHTLSTEEGQAALADFAKNAIPKEDLAELALRYPKANELQLVNEWVAKNQEQAPGIIARMVQQFREWIFKISNGRVALSPEQAARVMLRTLREQQTGKPQPQTEIDTGMAQPAGQFSLTPELRKFTEGSVAVDEDNNPKPYYHGSPSFEGNTFKATKPINRSGNVTGYYFTPDAEEARYYASGDKGAQVQEVYLAIKNPFIPGKSKITPEMTAQYRTELEKSNSHLDPSNRWFDGKVVRMVETGKVSPDALNGDGDAYQRVLKAGGYDGFQDGQHLAAFDSNQIKSATGNVGAYGQRPVTAEEAGRLGMTEEKANKAQAQGDTRFSLTEQKQVDSPEFKSWTRGLPVIDGRNVDTSDLPNNGVFRVYHGSKADFTTFKPKYSDQLIFTSLNPEFASQWALDRDYGDKQPRNYPVEVEKAERKAAEEWFDKNFPGSDAPQEVQDAFWKTQPRPLWDKQKADAMVYPLYARAQKVFNPATEYQLVEPLLESMPNMEGIVEKGLHKTPNWVVYENKTVVDFLKEHGYDSMWLQESSLSGAKPETLALFNKDQVKPVIGNVGAFGQRLITAEEAGRLGMTEEEANKAQAEGDMRFSLTETPAFKNWFEGSKVVDDEGKPLQVYHGTNRDFTIFGKDSLRFDVGWFTDSPEEAGIYARVRAHARGEGLGTGERIYPAYLDIKNPLVIDAEGSNYDRIRVQGRMFRTDTLSLAETAYKNGHDGLIVKNVIDSDRSPNMDVGEAKPITVYVVFNPRQVKSSTGNVGAFGQRPVTAEEAGRLGMTEEQAAGAQSEGDFRFSLTPEQIEAVDGRNIRELDVPSLVTQGVLTPKRGMLLDALREIHDMDVPIRVVDPKEGELPERAAGGYNPKTNEILLNKDAKSNLGKILLHEYTHALTLMGLRYANEFTTAQGDTVSAVPRPGVSRKQLSEASRQMDDLFAEAQRAADEAGEKFYGLNNREEFVAEAFSSSKFQDFLASIPSTKGPVQSLFDRFISLVKKILGVENESLLTDVIRATDPLVGAQRQVMRNLMADDTASRYSLTETPAFKNWFGDSKVVDKNGEPRVMYHGTNGKFSTFRTPAMFHVSKDYAGQLGDNVVQAYLSIKNPADLRALNISPSDPNFSQIAKELESQGYDGAQYRNEAYVAFNPTQIKSATDNIGTFDPNNPDILYSLTPEKVQEKQMADTTVSGPLKADEDGFIPTPITKAGAFATVVIGKNKDVEVPFVSFNQYANTVFKSKSKDPEFKGKPVTLAEVHIPVIQEHYSGLSRQTYREKNLADATEMVVNDMADNLLFLHDFAKSTFGNEVVRRMSKWYDGANVIAGKFADKYDITINQAAAMLAAFSPQKHWFANVSLAENVMDILKNRQDTVFDESVEKAARDAIQRSTGTEESKAKLRKLIREIRGKQLSEIEDVKEAAVFVRFLSQAIHPQQAYIVTPEGKLTPGSSVAVAWSGTGTTVNAIRAFLDGSNESLSRAIGGGHKVRNFNGNIIDPSSPLFYTSDTHNVAASLLIPVGGSDFEVGHNFGTNPKLETEEGDETGVAKNVNIEDLPKLPVMGTKITGLQGTYPIYVEAGRRAAEKRNILPRQMQSITWEMIRIMFTDDMKTDQFMADVKSVHDKVRKGRLTLPEAREKIVELSGGVDAIKNRPPEWLNR